MPWEPIMKFCPCCATELVAIDHGAEAPEQYTYQETCPACGVLAGRDLHQQCSRDAKTGKIVEGSPSWRFTLRTKGALA